MSISFDITESMLFREFTDTESSAIHCVSILHNNITIAWKTNSQKQYIFRGSDRFIAHLSAMIQSPDLLGLSLGSTIARARKNGDLEIIEFSEF